MKLRKLRAVPLYATALCAVILSATTLSAMANNAGGAEGSQDEIQYRRLPVSVYRDKMAGGWLGQIAGVCWGAPTEFRWNDEIIPAEEMPKWEPEMINNAIGQDDLYVEMTFLRTLEEYGVDVSQRQAGIDFANSCYDLWCANLAGRHNLRMGIAPPDSGHPDYNSRGNDIDYQIESDFAGLISPGMPNAVILLGEKFGRLMNYGDGLYGGQFMGGMYAEAFFTEDIEQIIRAGLACIPEGSQYAEMVRDLLAWHAEDPDHWENAWEKVCEKYRKNPDYQKASNGPIDVKNNGAALLLGLLFGNKDPDQTIIIATRAGWDSDCNPSSAAGVLFTVLGFSRIPEKFTQNLDRETCFSFTEYNFTTLENVCEKLAREILLCQGGSIERDEAGNEVFCIPVEPVTPSPLEFTWAPGPSKGARYSDEELSKIDFREYSPNEEFSRRFPGWAVSQLGPDMSPGLREEYRGKSQVFVTHPLREDIPCILTRDLTIPASGRTTLRVTVNHHAEGEHVGDWVLTVRVNGALQTTALISSQTSDPDGWVDVDTDLTPMAGQTVSVELANAANDWSWEAGYWGNIELINEP